MKREQHDMSACGARRVGICYTFCGGPTPDEDGRI